MRGLVYVPEQRDREHAGFVRDYRLEVREKDGSWKQVSEGTLLNTCRSQEILFGGEITGDALRLTVLSAYGCVDKYVYRERSRGWFREFEPKTAIVQIAGLHLICDRPSSHGDSYAASGEQKSKTKEIEL